MQASSSWALTQENALNSAMVAPLFSCLLCPLTCSRPIRPPATGTMASTEQNWHTLSDGAKVYTKTWKVSNGIISPSHISRADKTQPATPPIALLVFLHGFSDHCNRYPELFASLQKAGIQVHTFDQRGWGRSVTKPSEKGLTGPTSTVLSDITSVIQSQLSNGLPVFLMGHSMGGQETLQWASRGPWDVRQHVAGFLAGSPYIRLHPDAEPNKLTVVVGRLAGKLLPHFQLVQKLDPQWISRDKAVCTDWGSRFTLS